MGPDKELQDLGWSNGRLERATGDPKDEATAASELVLDSNGYPLKSQPSSDPQWCESLHCIDDFGADQARSA